MKYTALPVEVDAQKITYLEPLIGTAIKPGQSKAVLEDGSDVVVLDADEPTVGDFHVTWPDGEKSTYPAEEFEQRFTPAQQAKAA